jgi:hypothetical protein
VESISRHAADAGALVIVVPTIDTEPAGKR